MTKEALELGNDLLREIERIKADYEAIRPYLHEPTKLTIRAVNARKTPPVDRTFTLSSDSPLFLAIGTALEGMISELEKRLSDLDSNAKVGNITHQVIRQTSFWKKVWGR